MILRNSKLYSQMSGNILLGNIPRTKQRINNPVRRGVETIREWGQIALLLLKLFKLSKKVKVLALERENLLRERRDLIVQKRELALLLPLATQKCHILLQLAGRPWLDQTGESLDRLSSLANDQIHPR